MGLLLLGGTAQADPPDPTQIGFATLSNIAINGQSGTVAVVAPGAPVAISADYAVDHTQPGGTIYCPGCIDHIPVAFQGFGTQPQNASPGTPQQCFGPGGANHVYHGSSGSDTVNLGNAPTAPGTYNIIASFEFTYWCGQSWNPNGGTVIAQIVVAGIDIKPGSDPNSINLGSRGTIPVAILSSESFDATQVDPGSLTFGATGDEDSLHLRGRDAVANCGVEDVDADGMDDLVCHFHTQETGLTVGDTEATLKGVIDGVAFSASDSINIVP